MAELESVAVDDDSDGGFSPSASGHGPNGDGPKSITLDADGCPEERSPLEQTRGAPPSAGGDNELDLGAATDAAPQAVASEAV